MQYLVSVIDDKSNPGSTDRRPAISVFNDGVIAEGYWVFAGGLASSPSTATVIDNRGEDEAVFSDGPFVESKEYLAGVWVWEAPDLDVALRLAAEALKGLRSEGRGAAVPVSDVEAARLLAPGHPRGSRRGRRCWSARAGTAPFGCRAVSASAVGAPAGHRPRFSRWWAGLYGSGRRGGSSGRRPARAAPPSSRGPASRDGGCGTWGRGLHLSPDPPGREWCGPDPRGWPRPDSRGRYSWLCGRGPGAGVSGWVCSGPRRALWSHVVLAIGSRAMFRARWRSANCAACLASGSSRRWVAGGLMGG